jgi:signal transduction histidine kinase
MSETDYQSLLAELLSVIGHDLRNPLGVVLMGTAALQRAAHDPERVRKSAETVARAGERMNRIIDDVVDYVQITSHGLSIDAQPQPVAALMADLMEQQLPVATRKEIDLTLEIENDVTVSCDRRRVLRLLAHLVGNALAYTPIGGRVGVQVRREGQDVLFVISDDGPGVSAERLAHPFERRRGARKQPGEGIGLGLPIAHGVVEAHGGRIALASTPGRGTTISFTLPRVGS